MKQKPSDPTRKDYRGFVRMKPGGGTEPFRLPKQEAFLLFVNGHENLSMCPLEPEECVAELCEFDLAYWADELPRTIRFLERARRAVLARRLKAAEPEGSG